MAWDSHLQLRIIKGQFESNRIYALTQEQIDIGRLPRDYEPKENELLFHEPTLSRVHATLTWKPRQGGYSLVHKSDVNPTFVNGKNTRKVLLEPGDRIQMGLLILAIEETRGKVFPLENQAETLKRLHAIVAEVQQEFSHVKFDDDGPKG